MGICFSVRPRLQSIGVFGLKLTLTLTVSNSVGETSITAAKCVGFCAAFRRIRRFSPTFFRAFEPRDGRFSSRESAPRSWPWQPRGAIRKVLHHAVTDGFAADRFWPAARRMVRLRGVGTRSCGYTGRRSYVQSAAAALFFCDTFSRRQRPLGANLHDYRWNELPRNIGQTRRL